MELAKLFIHDFNNGDFNLFDRDNNLIFVENENGFSEQYFYDKNGREIYYCNSEGFTEKTSYDKDGNKILTIF